MYIIELFNKALVLNTSSTTDDRSKAKRFDTIEDAKSFLGHSKFNLIQIT